MIAGSRTSFSWLLLAMLAGTAWAQPKPAVDPPLLFRRELLPKSLLTREKEKLIPVPRKEFEQWLEKAQARAAPSVPEVWVESTELLAALQGNTLVGKARLYIRRRQSAKFAVEQATLSLAGLNLPIMQPKWEGDDQPAIVGMTTEGILLAAVHRSGVLSFDWQMPGRRDPFNTELFDLALMETSRSSIEVTLPRGSRLESSAGTVEQESAGDDAVAKWSVQLGSARETRLRCPPNGSQASGSLVLVREENRCQVSLGELETQCQLRLDVYREPVSQVEIELIGDWTPTSVRQGDLQVPFQVSTDGRTAQLRFDPPLSGMNRRLTFLGRSEVQEGVRIVAPRVRVRNAAWLDGTLAVDSNAVLLRSWEILGLDRAAESEMAGATRRWQLQSDQAQAAFVVERLPRGLSAETGATVRLDLEAATASAVADFTAAAAGTFHLEADMAPGWIIDSLETAPPDALDDWELVPQGSRQHLRIDLNRSVGPNQQLRVLIEAHRPAPAPAENLSGDQLRPLRWLAESHGYLALGIDPLWQLEFRGSQRAKPVDPSQLTLAQSDRLQIAEDVLLYADDDTFDSARLELTAETPQFIAAWQLRIASDGDRFQQQSELHVEPTAAPLERLHVLVRPAAGKALQWQLRGDEASALEARLVRASDGPDGEDEWELTLARARRNPFVLQASLESKQAGKYSARFFHCVEAASQSARIALTRALRGRLELEQATGLERLWNDGDVSGDLAQWSFDPAQSPMLVVRLATPQELRQLLLVQRASLESRLAEQYLLNAVEYSILNQQAQSLVVRLPENSELDHVLVDHRKVDPRLSASGRQLSISLPEASAPIGVRIVFRSPLTSQGAMLLIEPAWPEDSLPAAPRSWRVIFPDHYRQFTLSSPASWDWNDLWQRLRAPLPGFEASGVSSDASAPLACRQVDFHSSTGLPTNLRLIDGDALSGLSWLLLAACWAVVATRRSSSPRQMAWLVGGLGLAALCLPASLDPLARMMLLGCAAGLLSRRFRRDRVPSAPTPTDAPAPLAAATLGILIAIFTLAATAARVIAQERKPVEVIHRVIFPVDDAGKPADDYVYTSEPFYKELFRRAHQPALSGPAALLLAAEYRVRPRSDALAWETIEATLTTEVLQTGLVPIPWSREGFVVPPERMRLNGRPVPVTWSAEGTSFTVAIETAGRHTVQFIAQPTTSDDAQQCVLKLPPAASARLLLDTLDDAALLQVLPGPLPVASTGEDGVQVVELGQRRDVTLVTRPIDAPPAEVEAEQLLWTNLWRGGGVVEGRWRFQVASPGLLTEAVVDVGGDLELISAAALTSAAVQWLPEKGKARMVWSPRTPSEELVVEAVFVWRDSGAERVLPRIEPRGAKVTRRWLAIDAHGSSELTLAAAPPEERVDVAEFAALWNAEDWPQTAQRLPQPGPVLLSSSPVADDLSYEAETDCEIGPKSTRFEFRAVIKDLASPRTLIRLGMPHGAKIQSADVSVAGQYRAASWLPLAGHEVALLPTESVRSGNVLIIRGEVPTDGSEQSFSPPSISVGQVLSYRIDVTRRSDVRATLSSHEGFDLAPPTSDEASIRSVARLQLQQQQSGSRQLRWELKPNHPRTVGILVTTLRPQGQQWIARLDAFLDVQDGIVDAFHLESSGWNLPRLVSGDAAVQIQEPPGSLQQIELKPLGAPTNRYHFACEGTVAGSRVQAPSFRLQNAEQVQQYVRLPHGEEYQWSTSGLQETDLPAAVTLSDNDDLSVYRAAVPQFHVELRANQPVAPLPRVAWGHVNVSANADGSFVADATVAVEPSHAAALPATLPPAALLVHASVEGEAAIAELTGQRRFEIPLRSSTLPQVVRIVYSGERLSLDDLPSIAPRFDAWKLVRPLSVAVNQAAIPPPELGQIVPLLSAVLREPPQPDHELSVWASLWLGRLKEAQAQSGDPATDAELRQAEALVVRLEALTSSDPTFRDDLPEMEQQSETADPVQQHYSAAWLVALLGWSGIVIGGYRASQSARLQEIAQRWPGAAALLVGLAAAVLLSPWIGGALMLRAAVSSLAWPWQRPRVG